MCLQNVKMIFYIFHKIKIKLKIFFANVLNKIQFCNIQIVICKLTCTFLYASEVFVTFSKIHSGKILVLLYLRGDIGVPKKD